MKHPHEHLLFGPKGLLTPARLSFGKGITSPIPPHRPHQSPLPRKPKPTRKDLCHPSGQPGQKDQPGAAIFVTLGPAEISASQSRRFRFPDGKS